MDSKAKKILKTQIETHLIENPIDRTKPDPYKKTADKFKVDKEYIRSINKRLRKNGLVKDNEFTYSESRPDWSPSTSTPLTSEITFQGDYVDIKKTTYKDIKTLEDLIEVCEIDTKEWEIEKWQCKKWDLGIKNAEERIETKALFSVSARLKKKTTANSLEKQKEVLLEELKKYSPKIYKLPENESNEKYLLEISIFDQHFGKLSHRDETGEDYDIKIAEQRYKTAIEELLSRVDLTKIERILLSTGGDLIHFDGLAGSTTAGTPMDRDVRFHKVFNNVKRILIETIDRLFLIAPVDLVIVNGNHDQQSSFTTGCVLDAWYHNNENVNIYNSPKLRKYYEYGQNSILFTHGNSEPHKELGLIFATEEKELWARTSFRFVQLGHFHKNKTLQLVSSDEHQGIKIQILPSLCGTDSWHYSKGYMSMKQAKAFLFHKDKGLIGEFTYNV